jgi:hypothetical protein
VLQPYEEGKVEASLDTRRFTGPKTCVGYLETDDGKTMMVTLFYVKADAQDPPPEP